MMDGFGGARQAQRRARSGFVATFALATAIALAAPTVARAGVTIPLGDDDQWVNLGFGIRPTFTDTQRGAGNGGWKTQGDVESLRLYGSASFSEYIKATLNTQTTLTDRMEILDGIVQFEPREYLNVWAGRLLPPSDRANLDGPYYLANWPYPGVASRYPGTAAAGRMNGVTVWGKYFDKRLVYSAGVYEGHNEIFAASNTGQNPLLAARIVYNFLDPEPNPAYYESSTYFGTVDVLTLAIAAQHQTDGAGTVFKRGDFNAWNIDGLFEKRLGAYGAITFEGAYYRYYTGGVVDVSTSFANAGPTSIVGGLAQGGAWLAGVAYLIPYDVWVGKFQPNFRFQEFNDSLAHTSQKEYDIGLTYVIKGHNARITANYGIYQASYQKNQDKFTLGLQLQF
jgi:hypothetical protein